eukprot:CAMPEP_0181335784 /NCGR_PEP_ID=MMETSP1101-20121128/27033_1 /TAXON_ID=46948 /ORGANISM="Rhodomonas abbreviata, Strain Caron Lab Isolate" /LENGTH=192 /DNA_ID=CAMNT_0023445961 /DNA_START=286 /DNA_END=861 /DNA_ORIENTATION=-
MQRPPLDPNSAASRAPSGSGAPPSRRVSHDYDKIIRILQSMGVNHFDSRVVSVLRQFVYIYSTDVLERAATVSQYASKQIIDPEDIKFAIKLKIAHYKEFSHRPDRATLEKWAEQKNACPMPNLPTRAGIHLPQERFCLNAPNYQINHQDPKQAAQERAAAAQAQQAPPKKRRGQFGARASAKSLKIVLRFG